MRYGTSANAVTVRTGVEREGESNAKIITESTWRVIFRDRTKSSGHVNIFQEVSMIEWMSS